MKNLTSYHSMFTKSKVWRSLCLAGLCILFTSHTSVTRAADVPEADYYCGGRIEQNVWNHWDTAAKANLFDVKLALLFNVGDVRSIYDIQMFIQPLAAMALRCQDTQRLLELATLLEPIYDKLEPFPDGLPYPTWICHGGTCASEGYLNKDVAVSSIQILALTTMIANELARNPRADSFVRKTAITAAQHMRGRSQYISSLEGIIKKTPEDEKAEDPTGVGHYVYSTNHMGMTTILYELSGIFEKRKDLRELTGLSREDWQLLRTYFDRLITFFNVRHGIANERSRNGEETQIAYFDEGFWQNLYGMRYAGYTVLDPPPVTCIDGQAQAKINVRYPVAPPYSPPYSVTWDISHARRLVDNFDAITRNRRAAISVFNLDINKIPDFSVFHAFAQTFYNRTWLGDARYPKFANYFDGTNGWYDVAEYPCHRGFGPSEMTFYFTEGGYITWAKYNTPELRDLGRRLYNLSVSCDPNIVR